jgi:acyl-CoA synthetase (AMP-forming)/AMP-acid ligase II
MMTVVDLVARNARIYPDSVAFVEVRPVSKVRKEITWATFNEHMNMIAHVLAAKGIEIFRDYGNRGVGYSAQFPLYQ